MDTLRLHEPSTLLDIHALHDRSVKCVLLGNSLTQCWLAYPISAGKWTLESATLTNARVDTTERCMSETDVGMTDFRISCSPSTQEYSKV